MAIPFYYNPATNELELTADPSPLRDSLGTRFGLNEISIARKTLSPTKSYIDEDRIDMKPGGIVEPGVEYYAKKDKEVNYYSRRWHDERARKIKEARKSGLVYDPVTKEVRKIKVNKMKGIPRKVYRESIPQLDPKELPFEPLPKETIKEIKANFSNVVSEKEWKFDESRYGIRKKGNERIYDQIRKSVNEPKTFRYWTALTSPEGWMIAQMDRASVGSIQGAELYKPIYRTVAGKRRIAGFIDNSEAGGGKKYFASDRWIKGKDADGLLLQKSHPDFANTKKFYDIASKAHESPSKVITDILAKGGVNVTDKRFTFNHLLNYLIDEKGIDIVRRGMIIHHKGGAFGSPTQDYQILDKVINKKVQGIELRMRADSKNILKEDIAKLKKWGASVTIDGKTYGAGPKTAIGGGKKIQQLILEGSKDVELYGKKIKGIKEWKAKDFIQYGSSFIKNLPSAEIDKIATAVNCKTKTPAKKSEGGRIGFGAGSVGMLACIDAKWEKNPKGFFRATKGIVSKGMDTLWKYAAPYWLPAVVVATGRLESFKEPTKPDMWWEIFLASDAVKRLGLDKVQLSQLKNASLIKKADILGKLALSGGALGAKILTKAATVAKPLLVLTESLSAVKGIKSELDLVKEYALKNNIPYEDAKLAYYASAAALEPRWEGDKSFKSWASSKLIGGSTVYATAWQKRNDPEFQQIGKNVFQYIKENKPEPVEEEKVTEKVEIPSGLDWALNVEAQMKKKEPQQHAAVDSYFMGGIASLMK